MAQTIECTTNEAKHLPKKLGTYAFTQNKDGYADLTVGKKYVVYGYRENSLGTFYLILTDNIHATTPWWMPAAFFKEQSVTPLENWSKKILGHIRKDTIFAPEVYFDAIDDIEDGTSRGRQIFKEIQARIERDPED